MFASDYAPDLEKVLNGKSKLARIPCLSSLCLKVFNDKITLTEYVKRRVRFRWFSEAFKVDIDTGELIPWQYSDSLRRNKSFICSLSRTLRLIQEISDKNVFTHFITITFNEKFLDRSSAEDVHATFKKVIKRFKYKYGNFAYLAVPEYHEDGAIHYHCLFVFFGKRPRLFFKYYSQNGQKLFFITDKFFKDDIFVTVELLHGDNNISYLTKYITKGRECPLRRRFSCSRNLNRSRLVRSYAISDEFSRTYFRIAKQRGFEVQTLTKNLTCVKYDLWTKNTSGCVGGEAADPRSDLSIVNTKGENAIAAERLLELLFEDFKRERQLADKNAVIYDENGNSIKADRDGQLLFLLP